MTGANVKKVKREYLDAAMHKAKQSICRFKVAALGFNRDGDCVVKATNQPRFVRHGGGIHAEQRIFKVAKEKGVVAILICRVGNTGKLLPIDPCPACRKTAEDLNIRIVTVP
jgi:cytidine deaminase